MNRRKAIKLLGLGSLATIVGGGVYEINSTKPNLSMVNTLNFLKQLNIGNITSSAQWPIYQTFEHLAQSIEFSMIGYPQMKSEFFQNTAGKLAFSLFNSRKKMNHSLNELIPGEIISTPPVNVKTALRRLINALEDFDKYQGDLKPHFAYGSLSKSDYALAHIMHINNHFEEISLG